VFLRPYRGERLERDFTLKIPPGLSKGEHRILLSDADTLNHIADHGRNVRSLHRSSASGFAHQSGAQQQ